MTKEKFTRFTLYFGILAGILSISTRSQHQENDMTTITQTDGVTTNALSRAERDAILQFVEKREKYPGPSDAEVRGIGEILLYQSCNKTNVVALLGKPSSISATAKNASTPERWAYDVGDSRRVEIKFSTKGMVSEIAGTGVGFGKLKLKSGAGGTRTVVAEPGK